MKSVIVETTKYVLDYLKTIAPNALCRRAYDPIADIVELRAANKPIILVVPIDRTGELLREGGTVKNDLIIDIVVNAKLQHSAEEPELQVAEIDQLIELVEMIFAGCHKRNIKDDENGIEIHLMNPEHVVLSDIEMIQERNCFLSAIQINVKVFIDDLIN
ncbi:MAG: hypothetical protein LBK82_03690 [Planctomycetaceae bacterium]|jgi:hypothetical protein|nr:hypothetical protein [Planctomycetaceae bacterium]